MDGPKNANSVYEPSIYHEQRLRSGTRTVIEVGIEWMLLDCSLSR
jgi:hypothetical protein